MVIKVREPNVPGKSRNSASQAKESDSSWNVLKMAYLTQTAPLTKTIDVYLICCVLVALLQVTWCFASKQAYFREFLVGIMACLGSFVMAGKHHW